MNGPAVPRVKCLIFHWIGQDVRYCDACGRPTWEHVADPVALGGPFGHLYGRLRKRSTIERNRAISAGLEAGTLRIADLPADVFAVEAS